MKKICSVIIICLLLLTIGSTSVSANSGPPVIGITVEVEPCEYSESTGETFEGNLDILVRIEDLGSDSFTSINAKYKDVYPFYEDIEYLSSVPTGWRSFSAHYVDQDSWGSAEYTCGMSFGDNSLVEDIKYIRVVYFDDFGNTIYMSDEIEVPNVLFYQKMDSLLYYEIEENRLTSYMEPRTNPYLFLGVIAVFGLIFYSVIIELIVALTFSLKTRKALLHIFLINIITQVIMYLYFFMFFDSNLGNYTMQLLIYEGLVIVIEYLYLNWRLKGTITPKRLALYVIVSNVVSYILGIVRYY